LIMIGLKSIFGKKVHRERFIARIPGKHGDRAVR